MTGVKGWVLSWVFACALVSGCAADAPAPVAPAVTVTSRAVPLEKFVGRCQPPPPAKTSRRVMRFLASQMDLSLETKNTIANALPVSVHALIF